MRVAADELRVHRAGDRLEVTVPLLLEQEGEEVRLEEEVAELVEQLGRVAGVRGVGDLVGLLDRVGHDRPRRLLPVPGAVAAQALRQLLQLDERLGERPVARRGTGSAGGGRRRVGRCRRRREPGRVRDLLGRRSFLVSAVHFVIASFFAFSRSCALIAP